MSVDRLPTSAGLEDSKPMRLILTGDVKPMINSENQPHQTIVKLSKESYDFEQMTMKIPRFPDRPVQLN